MTMKKKYIRPTVQTYYLSDNSRLLAGSDNMPFGTLPIDNPSEIQ